MSHNQQLPLFSCSSSEHIPTSESAPVRAEPSAGQTATPLIRNNAVILPFAVASTRPGNTDAQLLSRVLNRAKLF